MPARTLKPIHLRAGGTVSVPVSVDYLGPQPIAELRIVHAHTRSGGAALWTGRAVPLSCTFTPPCRWIETLPVPAEAVGLLPGPGNYRLELWLTGQDVAAWLEAKWSLKVMA